MKVVLSGGGTGGHVYPALSIAEQCLRQDPASSFLYIGTNSGLEKEIVEKSGLSIPFEAIEITGFRRSLSMENVKTVIRFFRGVSRAKKLLKQFKPDIVVGTGGYVCGPVVYAAAKLGIPTMVHEQNVIPGLTNKFLSRYADSIGVSFPGSEGNFPQAKHVLLTGNPRATTVSNADAHRGWESLGLPDNAKLVVIAGGSRGAQGINEAVVQMVPFLSRMPDTHFVCITGTAQYDSTLKRLQEQRVFTERMRVVPYIHNMHEVLAATSLIVSRAGASFLAEITALGIPSVLIPSPYVTNNHQEANARLLEREKAAEVILERDLTGAVLFAAIDKIVSNPMRREMMANRSKAMGKSDSASLFVGEMLRLSRKNHN